VMVTHHVEELGPLTSDVLLLCDGAIAARGAPAQVLESDALSRAYRVPLRVHREHSRYYVRVDPGAWRRLLES
jgi:iron complex transport system ATP-binding protein